VFAPDEEVDENSDTKYYSRIQGSGQQGSSLNTGTNYTHLTNPSKRCNKTSGVGAKSNNPHGYATPL